MKVPMYILVVLSLVVLGAHFLRYGNEPGVVASLATIALLFVRKRWAVRIVQVILVLGAVEWARTLYELVQVRLAHGMPATRMVIILGVVIVLTIASALLFETQAMKQVYKPR